MDNIRIANAPCSWGTLVFEGMKGERIECGQMLDELRDTGYTGTETLKFAGGAIGTIDNSRRAAYGYDQRVEVLGSKGSIETMNRYGNQAVISDGDSVRRDLPLNFFMDRYTESSLSEVGIRRSRTPRQTGSGLRQRWPCPRGDRARRGQIAPGEAPGPPQRDV